MTAQRSTFGLPDAAADAAGDSDAATDSGVDAAADAGAPAESGLAAAAGADAAAHSHPHTVPERRVAALSTAQEGALKLWVKLARAHSAIAAHATADIARHGLTLAEFGILEALYHRGPMLLGEVQRRILVSSGGITFLVDRLTAKGLVERRACAADRRARYAALTEQGVQLLADIFPAHADAIVRAVGGLDEAEVEDASVLLRKLGLGAAALPAHSSE